MDTATLIDRMVDGYNRHDTEALAPCYAPDARVHPAVGRRRSTPGPGWPPSAWCCRVSPTSNSIRATWPPMTEWRSWRPG
jgi:hypothetical protein